NLFSEQGRNANADAVDLDLPLFVAADRDDEIGSRAALPVALVLGNQAFGDDGGQFGVVFTAGLSPVAGHPLNRRGDDWQERSEAMRKRIGNLDFDRASHCVYHLAVHVVFCTKFRRHTLTSENTLTSEKRDFLKSSMEQIALAYNSQILEFNGEEDHVHMLLRYPPTVVLSS